MESKGRNCHFRWVMIILLAMIGLNTSHAEFTKSGQFVCLSLEDYRRLEYSEFQLAFELMQRGECTTLPPNYVVEVVKRTHDGYIQFRLIDDSRQLQFWTNDSGIARRLQPKEENIFIGGANDTQSICKVLALDSTGSADFARSIVNVQGGSLDDQPWLLEALANKSYELVVRYFADSCGVELDIENNSLMSCFVDTRTYFLCKRELGGQRVQDSDCFDNLCTAAADFQRPLPGEEVRIARARLREELGRDSRQDEEILSKLADKVAVYLHDKADAAIGLVARQECDTFNQELATDAKLRGDIALSVESIYRLPWSTSNVYLDSLQRDEFSMLAIWRDKRCTGVFAPASRYELPSVACYLVPREIEKCYESSGSSSNPISLGFCLNSGACIN